MKKDEATARQKERMNNRKIWSTELFLAILLAILAIISIAVGIIPILFGDDSEQSSFLAVLIALITLFICIWLGVLYFRKFKLFRESEFTTLQYRKEKKINEINTAVFDAINSINATKTRETLRYTYGSVPEWNPINYTDNIFLYDVHEQIRSILLSLQKVVISIDPTRFHDKNVSVELVYCYPCVANNNGELPFDNSCASDNRWKLISSGDTSGNHIRVSEYLNSNSSFYILLQCCGMKFANSKYAKKESFEIKQINKYLEKQNIVPLNESVFFTPDTKDMEYAENGVLRGSAVGTVINVRNDDPEETFVRAILTINTYGEPIHLTDIAEHTKTAGRRMFLYDKYGLTERDYESLFCASILSTYKTLLVSELTQMYIRHSIRNREICPFTGRKTNKADMLNTLPVSIDCNNCKSRSACKRCNPTDNHVSTTRNDTVLV